MTLTKEQAIALIETGGWTIYEDGDFYKGNWVVKLERWENHFSIAIRFGTNIYAPPVASFNVTKITKGRWWTKKYELDLDDPLVKAFKAQAAKKKEEQEAKRSADIQEGLKKLKII